MTRLMGQRLPGAGLEASSTMSREFLWPVSEVPSALLEPAGGGVVSGCRIGFLSWKSPIMSQRLEAGAQGSARRSFIAGTIPTQGVGAAREMEAVRGGGDIPIRDAGNCPDAAGHGADQHLPGR